MGLKISKKKKNVFSQQGNRVKFIYVESTRIHLNEDKNEIYNKMYLNYILKKYI